MLKQAERRTELFDRLDTPNETSLYKIQWAARFGDSIAMDCVRPKYRAYQAHPFKMLREYYLAGQKGDVLANNYASIHASATRQTKEANHRRRRGWVAEPGEEFLFFENRCKHLFRFLTRVCVLRHRRWMQGGTGGRSGRWRHRRYRGKGLYTSLTRPDTTEGKPSIISAVNEMCQR